MVGKNLKYEAGTIVYTDEGDGGGDGGGNSGGNGGGDGGDGSSTTALSAGAVAGVTITVIIVLLLIASLVLLTLFIVCKKKRSSLTVSMTQLLNEEMTERTRGEIVINNNLHSINQALCALIDFSSGERAG